MEGSTPSKTGEARRWTSKRFAVDLGVPPDAKKNGATLHFNFAVPEVALKANPALALTASISGTEILAAKYKKAGPYEFIGDVPATALQADHVRVDFTLDKSFSPGGADTRDLGADLPIRSRSRRSSDSQANSRARRDRRSFYALPADPGRDEAAPRVRSLVLGAKMVG